MKNKFIQFFFSSLLLVALVSCEKEENKVFLEGGTAPVLSANKSGTIPMSFLTKDQEAVKISWTNPNYTFTTGLSSHNVTYQLEIDTTGANFTNPGKKVISIANDMSLSITQEQLSGYLSNDMQLKQGMSHNIEMRVKATIAGNAAPLYSNVLKFTATPFVTPPKVEPPTAGTLWMTGDAAPSGWANPLPAPYNVSQKFTKVSETLYELTVTLPGGGAYKLIQEQGNWGTQYHMLTGGTWSGGDFEKKDSDPAFQGPPTSGTYKITVDFQRGKFTVEKL